MIQENSMINFQCNACGACCKAPPKMNFFEMLDLSDEFIFQMAHNVMLSSEKNLPDKKLLEHYQIVGHTIVMPELESSMFYYINFIPLQLKSYKSCSKLENNLCSIYGKRPNSCKLLPVAVSEPLSLQTKNIEFFKKMTDEKKFNCDFSESAPEFFNTSFTKDSFNKIYQREIMGVKETTDLFIEFLADVSEERKNDHFKAIFQSLQNNTLMISDVFGILHATLREGIIGKEIVEEFINNQIKLMQKEIDYSTNAKLKENLEITRFYKNLVETYKRYLKEKPYIISSSDEVFI